MSAFGHWVRPLDRHDEADGWRQNVPERCRAGARKGKPGCQRLVEWVCEYSYVTGRAGRVTTNRKGRCTHHAQMFANKHDIDGPDEILARLPEAEQ